MKNLKNKGFLSIPTLVIGIVLILIGVGVYISWNKNFIPLSQNPPGENGSIATSNPQQIKTNPRSISASTDGRTIFRDKTYGIELQCPSDWHFYDSADYRILHGIPHIQFDSFPSSSYSGAIMPNGGSVIAIYRSTSTTPEQAMWNDMTAGDYLITSTSTIVDGIIGLKASYTHILGIQNVGVADTRIAVYVPYGGYTYAIIFDSRKNPTPVDFFDEFLSRFKFIPSNAVSSDKNSKVASLDFQFALDLADNRVLMGASRKGEQ